MANKDQSPTNPDGPKNNEVAPAVENFNDGDANQVVNTADDAFDEAGLAAVDKVPIENEVLPPCTTDVLDDGEQPVLNQDDKAL